MIKRYEAIAAVQRAFPDLDGLDAETVLCAVLHCDDLEMAYIRLTQYDQENFSAEIQSTVTLWKRNMGDGKRSV